jgi:phosphotransferase system HPr (HPr) family protein
MTERKAVVRNPQGIHCRPSAVIVKAAEAYEGTILIQTANGEADCRSIMGLLCLGLEEGAELTITATGPDEANIAAKLVALFETRFDFPPRNAG